MRPAVRAKRGVAPPAGSGPRQARPSWFAMVMATGIVSVALHRVGWNWLSATLLVIGLAGFAVIGTAVVARAAVARADLAAELGDYKRAFTACAAVAACAVLGDRLAAQAPGVAAALAAAAAAVWLALVILLPLRLAGTGRPAAADVNGSWYLSAVGTQALAIAATFLHADGILPARLAWWAGTSAWLAGVLLYLAVCAAVAARLRVAGLGVAEATAPYWVAMGAASISVLAAAQLLLAGAGPATIGADPLKTLATALWVTATCLIPVLAVRSVWRHVRGSAVRYRADLWMVVFPAGMYAMASMQLGTAERWPVVRLIGTIAVWPATAAWLLTFAALIVSLREPGAAAPVRGAS